MTNQQLIVIPWSVEWPAVFSIDNGGIGSIAMAEKIVRLYKEAGVECVPVGGKHPEWLLPIYENMGVRPLFGYAWNSIMKPFVEMIACPEQRRLFEMAYAKWYGHLCKQLRRWRPDVIFIDQEKGVKNMQYMPSQLRDDVNMVLGEWTPVYHYRGGKYYGEEIDMENGSGPCPAFYYIWGYGISPVEKLHDYFVSPANVVRGGYPWISPYKKANELHLGLIGDIHDWIRVCRELRDAGAKGFSMYPSPFSKEAGALGDPTHMRLVEFLRAGVDVWR